MDPGVRFVVSLAEKRAARLTDILAELSGRGEAFCAWAVEEAQQRVDRLEELKLSLDKKSRLTVRDARRVDRVVEQLDALYEDVVAYRRDIGRSDLPAGLLYAIDALVNELLSVQADYVIHNDRRNMYSTVTLGLARGYLELVTDSAVLEEVDSAETEANLALQVDSNSADNSERDDQDHPIVLNLPGLDAANAVLLPVLAHEVGHIAARLQLRRDLASLDEWPQQALQESLTSVGAGRRPSTLNAWSRRFAEWTTEYICDAVATAVSGPCFVLAQAAMLRVSTIWSEPYEHHPPTRDRVRFSYLMTLKAGWGPWYEEVAPKLKVWLDSLVEQSDPIDDVAGPGSEIAFLRAACRSIEKILSESISNHVSTSLNVDSYQRAAPVLTESIAEGIPPAQPHDLSPPSMWMLILAAWEVELTKSDAPETLATTVGNYALNEFLIKSNELARIAEAWRREDGS